MARDSRYRRPTGRLRLSAFRIDHSPELPCPHRALPKTSSSPICRSSTPTTTGTTGACRRRPSATPRPSTGSRASCGCPPVTSSTNSWRTPTAATTWWLRCSSNAARCGARTARPSCVRWARPSSSTAWPRCARAAPTAARGPAPASSGTPTCACRRRWSMRCRRRTSRPAAGASAASGTAAPITPTRRCSARCTVGYSPALYMIRSFAPALPGWRRMVCRSTPGCSSRSCQR